MMVQSLVYIPALDSLVGHLVHASNVMPLGRAFLNRLFPALRALQPGQRRRLDRAAREDLAWWYLLCNSWVGASVHQIIILDWPHHHLFTDASGSWGCGAWASPLWFQLAWPDKCNLPSIALKELVPIVLAAIMWGHSWSGSLVLCHSDNAAAVAQVNRLHASDPRAGHMLRCLAFLQATCDFRMRAVHIPGRSNNGADDLSHNRIPSSTQFTSSASSTPSQVPLSLVNLLTLDQPNWTSMQYGNVLRPFCRRALPQPPEKSTNPA